MKTIGVFDSGVGGLSVLRALLAEIPQAHFVYLADGAHAPYGERSPQQIAERAHRITEGLRHHFGIDALVVACNTATALAIEGLRAEHADWPIVGVEPALKPAAALTRTGHVGVMATRGTVESERYSRLRQRLESGSDSPLHFSSQACDGLADAIERDDKAAIQSLCKRYWEMLKTDREDLPAIDTLVLGCTHYPLVREAWLAASEGPIALIDPAEAVARRARHLLPGAEPGKGEARPSPTWRCTGHPEALRRATRQWLDLPAEVRSPQS